MNPNEATPQSPLPGGQPTEPPAANNQPNPSEQLPVFRNPLAQGYEDHTSQLPPMPTVPPDQSTLSQVPPPLPNPTAPSPPLATGLPVSSNQPLAPESASPAQPVSSQPKISELVDAPIKPAPVRLAPVPRSDDIHAAGAQATSRTSPFGTTQENTPPQPVSTPTTAPKKTKSIGMIISIAGGVVLILLAAIGFYAYQITHNKNTTTSPQEPDKVESVRDKTEKPIQPFSEKIETECYVAQALTPVVVDGNKDCDLNITYGEQKISSIFISALSEFDIVTDTNGENTAQNSLSEVNMEQYLDALIADIIDKELVTERSSIEVGNLAATKVVGKTDANSNSEVVYTFIVLPEEERTFGEKQFVAFIITGAYNDDYSRKGYDQFLTTWSWK